nr:hypothetical protein [bacterium]
MEYDQLFKDLLEAFFKPFASLTNDFVLWFIELFFPDVAVRLDWLEIEFLKQEKFTDIPAGESRYVRFAHQRLRLMVDVVAKIATTEGEPEIILVHVDIEHPWR